MVIDILFAAFGGWDAAGAKSFGYSGHAQGSNNSLGLKPWKKLP